MELARAIEIVEALMDGHDPYTGEVFEHSSVFQNADTVRALAIALDSMKAKPRQRDRQRIQPQNAGKPWTEEETARLVEAFDRGKNIDVLAEEHCRTHWAIRRRLISLDKIQY